jgi:hypothetical protein
VGSSFGLDSLDSVRPLNQPKFYQTIEDYVETALRSMAVARADLVRVPSGLALFPIGMNSWAIDAARLEETHEANLVRAGR